MEYKHFAKDDFFKPNLHPQPQIFSELEFQNVLKKIESNRPLKENPLNNPGNPDISHLKSTESNPGNIPPHNPGTFNTGQNKATQNDSGQFEIPLSENFGEHLNTFTTKPDILENEFQVEAFKIILSRVFDILFIYLSRHYGRDMKLTKEENKTIVDSAIPVARKYSKGQFKYAEEVGLLLAIGGVVLSKTVFMNDAEIKIEDKKMEEKKDVDPTIEQTAVGMMDVLKSTIKKGDIQSRDLNDLEYQKAKKLISIYNPAMDATRKDCETFIAVLESMSMNIDFLSEIADKIDPEQIKKVFGGILIQ